ncbi:AAA family ATPase [Kribbella sp. NPDC050281]|uniref:AAA family ATPase n=1 Tax=Kribbella sp. NPDC050281 TaxID=3155515 RepID=UPI0033EC5F52
MTGGSGVGKSTVCGELRRRGYDAFDADQGLARWFANGSGVEVVLPADRDDDWFLHNTYRLPPDTVRRLGGKVGDRVGFVCGTVGNDNEIWELFTHVVSLSVDAQTLRQRLAARTNGFGSTEAEVQRILAWHATAELNNARYGALIVDATPPPSKVVDNLLTALDLPT